MTGTANSAGHGGGVGGDGGSTVRIVRCGVDADDGLLDDDQSQDASCTGFSKYCVGLHNGNTVALLTLQRAADGTWQPVGTTCVSPANAPPAPQLTAADVRARAVRLIPSAAIGVAPRTATLVNIDTVLWVDTAAKRTLPTVSILGRQVVIAITLDHVDWRFGDGSSVTAHDAGHPYDSIHNPCRTARCTGYFSHVYTATGAVRVTATVSWTAAYRADGGPAQTIPGVIAGPVTQTPLQVKQARGVLVPNPGDR